MKNTKWFLAALVVAVLFSALKIAGDNFSSTNLQTAVTGGYGTVGDYGYSSQPINFNARNFYCNPGPISTSGKYSGTYNTYYYSYSESYANSGVKGTWCSNYLPLAEDSSLYDDPPLVSSGTDNPTDHTTGYISAGVYKVTNADGSVNTNNTMYRRLQEHIKRALIHQDKVVFYQKNADGYGTYYQTGASYGGSNSLDPAGTGIYGYAVVHCPAGAVVVDHATTSSPYKANSSSRHYGSSPSQEDGLYDGEGHKWCELNGVAVNPELGPESGKSLPDTLSSGGLKRYTMPDGTNYYKNSSGSWVTCTDGYAGSFTNSTEGTHFHCLGAGGASLSSSTATGTGPVSPYNMIMFSYSSSGGAAGTVGSGACAEGTFWCQTSDNNYRYCSADSVCTANEFTPPAPTFTLADPTNVQLDSTYHAAGKTSFKTDEAIYFKAKRNITGTGIPSYPSVLMRVKISNVSGNFSAPVWTGEAGGTTTTDSMGVAMPANTLVAGTYYFCAEMAMNNNNNMVTSFSSANQKTACVASSTVLTVAAACSTTQTWNGTSCVNTCPSGSNWDSAKNMCVSSEWKEVIWNNLGLKSYVSIYASQSVIDAAKAACANTEPSKVTWPNPSDFTRPESAGIPSCGTTAGPTLNGTIFKDGQYVDPATFALRNCVSPSYWMKEGPTASGARGFHCMPNTPDYTLTSDHYPPTPCVGTLWAGSSNGSSFSADYCANSKDGTTPPPTSCNYDGVCSNGETTATCAADCGYTPPTTCKLGQSGCDVNLSCDQGRRCYVGGKLSCLDWNTNCGGTVCAPQGSSSYYSNCKEPGSITDGVDNNGDGKVDDFPGYCESAMSCYSGDGKQRYCQPMDFSVMMGTAAVANHPTCSKAGFTNSCSPTDTSCVNVGKRGTSGYCAPEGKQCHDDNGFLCVAEGSECPAGSGVCPTDPASPRYAGCTVEGEGSEDGYCAIMNSVKFYKQSEGGGIYCLKNPNSSDMNFWESATPPAGYGRCRYRGFEETGCIDKLNTPEDKVSGNVYRWCAVGMKQDIEVDGKSKVTCVSSKDYKPVDPVKPIDKICPMVITPAYNTTTLECMTFSNGCLGEGWARLGVNQACENGKVVDFSNITDDKALIEVIDKKLNILEGMRYRLKELPVNLSETGVIKELLEKATKAFMDLRVKLPAKTATAKEEARAELERINKNLFAEIEAKWAKVQAHIDFATLRDEIYSRLPELKYEAGSCDQLSEYCKSLNELVPTLESFLKAAEGQTGQAFDQLMSDIRVTWEKIQTIMKEERGGHRDRFFESQVKQLMDVREGIRTFIDSHDIKDTKIIQVFEQFDALVTYLAQIVVSGDIEIIPIGIFPMGGVASSSYLSDPKHILDKAFALKARLEGYLKVFSDYDVVYVTSLEELLPFVQEEVKRQLEELMPEIARTIKVLMDEALQELTLNMIAIVDEMKPEIKEAVAQGLENLAIDLNEKRREILDEVIAAKNEIVKRLSDLEALVVANLGSFTANQYRTRVIEVVAPVVWCGDYAALVESEINNAGLALENGEEVDIDELHTFVTDAMASNVQECRRVGASRFYMPIESWYWQYVEKSADRGCINGYSADSGEATGYFGEGDPTLRIEALKMVSCIFGVEQGDAVTDRSDIPWGAQYFNGLRNAGVEFDWNLKMNEEISRFEIADLVVQTMLAVDQNDVIPEATVTDQIKDFTDAGEIGANEYALAVETLVDLGVLTGHSDGRFGGYDSTLRSEFAAVLDRVNDLIVETYDIQGTVE